MTLVPVLFANRSWAKIYQQKDLSGGSAPATLRRYSVKFFFFSVITTNYCKFIIKMFNRDE